VRATLHTSGASKEEQPVSTNTTIQRVFLLDDHDVVREGLFWALQEVEDIQIVGEASTATEGLAGILRTQADIAIVDSVLPDGDGITVMREVRSRQPATRCVVFTSFPEEEALYASILAGAAGYIPKTTPRREFIDAVRRVGQGESLVERRDVEAFHRRRADALGDDVLLRELTGQERRILEMMTEGETNREIALRLGVAEKTIRNYVSVILSKLGMRNRTQAAVYMTRRTSDPRRPGRLLRHAG
jgi:two-component system, NarL family, response regulator DevR